MGFIARNKLSYLILSYLILSYLILLSQCHLTARNTRDVRKVQESNLEVVLIKPEQTQFNCFLIEQNTFHKIAFHVLPQKFLSAPCKHSLLILYICYSITLF